MNGDQQIALISKQQKKNWISFFRETIGVNAKKLDKISKPDIKKLNPDIAINISLQYLGVV